MSSFETLTGLTSLDPDYIRVRTLETYDLNVNNLKLMQTGPYTTTLTAQNTSSNLTLALPSTTGTYLTTDGSGNLQWGAPAVGGSGFGLAVGSNLTLSLDGSTTQSIQSHLLFLTPRIHPH